MNGVTVLLEKVTLKKNKDTREREAILQLGLGLSHEALAQFPPALARAAEAIPAAQLEEVRLRGGTLQEHIFGLHRAGCQNKPAEFSIAAWPEKVRLRRDEKSGLIMMRFSIRGNAGKKVAIFAYENFGEEIYLDMAQVQMDLLGGEQKTLGRA